MGGVGASKPFPKIRHSMLFLIAMKVRRDDLHLREGAFVWLWDQDVWVVVSVKL